MAQCPRIKMLDSLGLEHNELVKSRQLKKPELVAKIATLIVTRKQSYAKWWGSQKAKLAEEAETAEADAKRQRLE